MITVDAAKVMNLQDYGLKEGKTANLVLIDAENVREAMAKTPNRPIRYSRGNG